MAKPDPPPMNDDLRGLRCPACDYDLTGLREHRCPECGAEFDPVALREIADGRRTRPRHRWVRLTFAMTMLIAVGMAQLSFGGQTRARIPDWIQIVGSCMAPVVFAALFILSGYWAAFGLRPGAGESKGETAHALAVMDICLLGAAMWFRLAYLMMKAM